MDGGEKFFRPYGLVIKMSDLEVEIGVEEAKERRDERLALVGCPCASCSTIAGIEFELDGRTLRSGRKDNPVHEYLSMRAFGIDRIAGGGMGSFAFEAYVTLIALAQRLAIFPGGPQDYDDSYVVDVREAALQIAEENGIGSDLGYGLQIDAIWEYLVATKGYRK